MSDSKRYVYKLIEHKTDENIKCVSGYMDINELSKLIFYIQARVHNEIAEEILLGVDEIADILVKKYGFSVEETIKEHSDIQTIDFIDVWDELIDYYNEIYYDEAYQKVDITDELLNGLGSFSSYFIYIDVGARIPKWAEDTVIEPLTMAVTHGGVLISGLNFISDKEHIRIREFFPKVEFFDENTMFFSFINFPAYKYTFKWTGRNVSISEVNEFEDKENEIIKTMNIGAMLQNQDYSLPINSKKQLDIVKKKMRLA